MARLNDAGIWAVASRSTERAEWGGVHSVNKKRRLHQSPLPEQAVTLFCNNDVVQDADAKDVCCIDQLLGDGNVLRTGFQTARGMVVDNYHGCTGIEYGITENTSRGCTRL